MTKLARPRVFAPLIALLLTVVVGGSAMAQNATITGRVTNEQGQPIAGANVFIQTLNVAASANAAGNYTLTVPNASGQRVNLGARFIGFVPHSRPITLTADQQTQNFTLKADPFRLEEVVVTGVTGATSTKKLPISVSRVSEDQMKEVPASNPIMALAGKVPGAKISAGRGNPGAPPAIRLRGSTSLTVGGSSPMIIVDGVITNNSIADIDANDVESVEVLKGAAASSFYGSNAANGVVNITTKRGRNIGDNRVSYTLRTEYGQSGVEHYPSLMKSHHYETNADGSIKLVNGSRQVTASGIADNPYQTTGPAHWRNQLDEWLTNGVFYSNNLQIGARRGNTNLNTSWTSDRNQGVLPFIEGQYRQNLRLNVDQGLNAKADLSVSLTYGLVKNDYDPNGSAGWFAFLQAPPEVDLKRPNDLIACPTATAVTCVDYFPLINSPSARENPLYGLKNQRFNLRRERMLGSFTGRYRPVDWLRLEGSYGTDRLNRAQDTYNFKGFLGSGGVPGTGSLREVRNYGVAQNSQVSGTATRLWMGNLLTTTRVAYLFEDERAQNTTVDGTKLNVFDVPDLQAADPTQLSATNNRTTAITKNVSAAQTFDYKDRYILDVLWRKDESSLFGPDARASDFYRVAARYRIGEDFTIPHFQELSIRAAQGTAGLRPPFSAQYETYSVTGGQVTKAQLGNKNLKPAIQTETEIGLNATFLNRFDLEVVQADRVTKGAIIRVPLSLAASGGFTDQQQNAADVKASTLELALQTRVLDRPNLLWSMSLTGDHTTQKITKLGRPPFRVNADNSQGQDVFFYKQGEELGVMYGQKYIKDFNLLKDNPANLPATFTDAYIAANYTKNYLGYVVLKSQRGLKSERPIVYVDKTGSNVVKIGDVNPDFTFGVANNLRWKGLGVYALIDGQQGGQLYNFNKQWMFQDFRSGDADQSKINPADKIALDFFGSGLYNALAAADYFIEDASFVKLRELSVSYTLDQNLIQKMRLGGRASSIKLALIGRNLKTWTSYTGFDPDVTSGSDFNFRIDGFKYPNFRTFTGQVEIIF